MAQNPSNNYVRYAKPVQIASAAAAGSVPVIAAAVPRVELVVNTFVFYFAFLHDSQRSRIGRITSPSRLFMLSG
jgi:hypothetical protein